MEIKQPGAHIDHMLRQTRMHNMQLSTMADMKSSMLLTVASLVLGLSLTNLATSPRDAVFLVLAIASVLTIVMAIYATMPKAGPKPFLRKGGHVESQNFTLLFFGDYANLSYEDFEKSMEVAMNDPNMTYEIQVRELYNLGRYLADHKFRKLRLAYLAFLVGVVGAAAIASVQFILF